MLAFVRRDALVFLFVTAASAGVFACSAIVDFDGLAGPVLDAASSVDSTIDAPESSDDASIAKDAPAEVEGSPPATVLFTYDFESGCPQSYGVYMATLSSSSVAHSGAMSCMVCYSGTSGTSYSIDHGLGASVPSVGSQIDARGWVRAVASTSVAQATKIALRTDLDQHNTALEQSTSDIVTLSTTWQLVDVTLSVTKSGAIAWDYFVSSTETNDSVKAGDCFLVDDVVITQLH